MDFITRLLSEKGDISTTRFVQVIGLIMAFAIAMYGMSKSTDLVNLSILCVSFIIPQTVAKVMQKKVEVTKDETKK